MSRNESGHKMTTFERSICQIGCCEACPHQVDCRADNWALTFDIDGLTCDHFIRAGRRDYVRARMSDEVEQNCETCKHDGNEPESETCSRCIHGYDPFYDDEDSWEPR